MKKVFVSFCMAAVLTGLSSCASTKSVADMSVLGGEWNIIEINGSAVVPAPGDEFPYIGFDTKTGQVHGSTGCNRLLGNIDIAAKAGTIDFSGLGSTRMMCADMTVENKLLSAMAEVKRYKRLGNDSVALCNASNRPLIVLKKR